jgi:hypothetical protein
MRAKGLSRWYPIRILPAQNGVYECLGKITSSAPPFRFMLEWDGLGFVTQVPMVVSHWRGMTAKAHAAAVKKMRAGGRRGIRQRGLAIK